MIAQVQQRKVVEHAETQQYAPGGFQFPGDF